MARPVTETDRAIIRLLQRDARLSFAEISRATGIPESTVRRRLERLQQRDVIEFAVIAEPSRLGYDLRAMIGLRVDLPRLDELTRRLRQMDEVTFAAFVTGSFDIVLHVVVRSHAALVEFLTKRLSTVEGIRSLETFVMPEVIKPATAWVLPDGADLRPDGPPSGDGAEPATGEQEATIGQRRRGRARRAAGARGAAEEPSRRAPQEPA